MNVLHECLACKGEHNLTSKSLLTDNDDTEEVTTKKIKTESESINLSWEWEADGPTWTAYADDVNKEITDAFKSGKQKAPFSDNGKKFEVVFSRMVQRNAITCWERQIRLKEASDDEDGEYRIRILSCF